MDVFKQAVEVTLRHEREKDVGVCFEKRLHEYRCGVDRLTSALIHITLQKVQYVDGKTAGTLGRLADKWEWWL